MNSSSFALYDTFTLLAKYKNLPTRAKESIPVEIAHYTCCCGIVYSINSIGKMRISALIPVVLSIAALILSFLCLFAGSKKGFMDSYAVVTVSSAT